jgi:uncharacterized alpha/beta hydrolase family protein
VLEANQHHHGQRKCYVQDIQAFQSKGDLNDDKILDGSVSMIDTFENLSSGYHLA